MKVEQWIYCESPSQGTILNFRKAGISAFVQNSNILHLDEDPVSRLAVCGENSCQTVENNEDTSYVIFNLYVRVPHVLNCIPKIEVDGPVHQAYF